MMMGMGDKFDESSLKAVGVGGFAKMPQRMNHYVVSKGETIIQVSGKKMTKTMFYELADRFLGDRQRLQDRVRSWK